MLNAVLASILTNSDCYIYVLLMEFCAHRDMLVNQEDFLKSL